MLLMINGLKMCAGGFFFVIFDRNPLPLPKEKGLINLLAKRCLELSLFFGEWRKKTPGHCPQILLSNQFY